MEQALVAHHTPSSRFSVMYRDLKPDNIGFDVRGNHSLFQRRLLLEVINTYLVSDILLLHFISIGDVKIFDFGLAKEFDPSKADKSGCYNLTGDTGSTRYMAPEVGLSKPYNEKVDVYSFGILFYQIMALETPFQGLTVRSFPKMVFEKGARPVPDPKWPSQITDLMKKCWSANISERPSMEDVSSILFEEINANTDEDIIDIMDASRKSELSLRGGNPNPPVLKLNSDGGRSADPSLDERNRKSGNFQC